MNRDGRGRRGRPLSLLAVFCTAAVWSAMAAKPALAQPPQPFVPEITERSGLLMRFAASAGIPASRPASRLLLQHALRRQRANQAPELVSDPGTLWAGLEDARHQERLSLLLRYAWPEHDRFVEPPVAAGLASSRGWPTRGGRSGCTTTSAPTCRSTTSTRSPRDLARIRTHSTSTGCTAAEWLHPDWYDRSEWKTSVRRAFPTRETPVSLDARSRPPRPDHLRFEQAPGAARGAGMLRPRESAAIASRRPRP